MISRNLSEAENDHYDLIIVGAGIYGVALALMASLNGKKNLILDRGDFGAATTFNSLRIVHGGLRYLQNLDLVRFFESVQERRWFFRNFPQFVKPVPCLMPLYGKGMKRPAIFGPALILNDLLSHSRNRGVSNSVHIGKGHLVSKSEVHRLFSLVDPKGLMGGAVWHDGSMEDSQLIVMEMLRHACSMQTTACNYCEATELIFNNKELSGIVAKDKITGKMHQFRANKIINAAGPWSRRLASEFDKDYPDTFHRSKAWNVLFDREQLSSHALAVTPKNPDASTYFLRPFKGKLFAGTVHEACAKDCPTPYPTSESLHQFIHTLNEAIPGADLKTSSIVRIYAGFLPATEEGSHKIAVRAVIRDHGKEGGPSGLFSVSGVKFTTARLVAEKTLRTVFPNLARQPLKQNLPSPGIKTPAMVCVPNFDDRIDDVCGNDEQSLLAWAKSENVLHMDDLLFRRSSIGDNPERARQAARILMPIICDSNDAPQEMAKLEQHFSTNPDSTDQ